MFFVLLSRKLHFVGDLTVIRDTTQICINMLF